MKRGRGRGGGSAGCGEECRSCGYHGLVSDKSFFKVLIGPDFSDLLYIPPKFAPELSRIVGQKVVLEDSVGYRWRVKLTKHRGSLALWKGWRDFLSDHGLEIGDFLVFHYLGSHFVVKIYDKTACEKTKFREGLGNNEAASTRKGPRVGESLTGNRCSDSMNEGRSRHSCNTKVESEDEVVLVVSSDEAKEGYRTVAKLSVSEMQGDSSDYRRGQSFVDEEMNSCDQPRATQMPDDGALSKMATDDCKVILDVDPLAIVIHDSHAFGERSMINKRGRPPKKLSTTSIKKQWRPRKNFICEEPLSEIENSALLKLTDKSLPILGKNNLSLKVKVVNPHYLMLPVNLLSILPKSRGTKKSKEGRVVILEDQLQRWWPVLYRQEQVNFLSTGWKCFSEANHITPGDQCLLVTRDLSKAVFGVSILPAGCT